MPIKDPHTLICRFKDPKGVWRRLSMRFATARECQTMKYGLNSKDRQIFYGGQIVHEEEAPSDFVAQIKHIQSMLEKKT